MYIENNHHGEASLYNESGGVVASVSASYLTKSEFVVNLHVIGPLRPDECKKLINGLLQLMVFSGLESSDVLDRKEIE